MKHGSLFSGIGGFDLAAQWMGWDNEFHCEWNPFGQKVLKHYWPGAASYEDITTTDFTIHRERIDILSGGFPCQPYSQAGKRLGKEDDRHLWPEMLRAIREIRPHWVVGENVRGLTNWSGGLVFDEVQANLEDEGYEVTPFLLPACAVNAPHRRDRIWFIAKNAMCSRLVHGQPSEERSGNREQWDSSAGNQDGIHIQKRGATNPDSELLQRRGCSDGSETAKRYIGPSFCGYTWENFPTQPPICDGDDGFSTELDGITFSKWRNESIKAGGNAIVPQVAHQIFKAIQQYEDEND